MSLSEDLCLLAVDPDTGRTLVHPVTRGPLLGAAQVADLESRGLITLDGEGVTADVRRSAGSGAAPAVVRAATLARALRHGSTIAPVLVAELAEGAWRRQVRLLVEDGVLVPVSRWPFRRYRCDRPERRVLAVRRVRSVMQDPAAADVGSRRLAGLALAGGLLGQAVGGDEVETVGILLDALAEDPVLASYGLVSHVTAKRFVSASGAGT